VHRLDKGTSGLLVLARDVETAAWLNRAWRAGQVHKTYLCVVRGWPAPQGVIDRPLARDPELPTAGQPLLWARTAWRVLRRHHVPVVTQPPFPGTRLGLLAVSPHTGRRHQIRRHLKHMGYPLLGDSTHGKGPFNRAIAAHVGARRLWLHAWQLSLPRPNGWPPLQLQVAPEATWQRWWADSAP
jgi:tRNA pseudouridine65 synthase